MELEAEGARKKNLQCRSGGTGSLATKKVVPYFKDRSQRSLGEAAS
jgi:hypothetical protein